MFAKMLAAALLALTADNLFFSGGVGFSRALRAARQPASVGVYALFVTAFSLGSALAGHAVLPLLPASGPVVPAAVMAAAAGGMYLVAAAVLRAAVPRFFEARAQLLAQAAANSTVVAVAFSQEALGLGWSGAVGFALGTGAAFLLAALLLERALKICSNPDMPRAFAGLPGVLVYIGILSMAFAGFSGNVF